jgi:hypothetical protein
MILLILAALGVPLWFVMGLLGGAIWSRRRFRARDGVFVCKVRPLPAGGQAPNWGRAKSYAFWVHDVLLVHSGAALVRYHVYPTSEVVEGDDDLQLTFGGSPAATAVLSLDDGTSIEVAADTDQRALLLGPATASRSGA